MGINSNNGGRPDPEGIRTEVSDLKERVAALRQEIEEQAKSFETRFEHIADDVKSKLKRAENLQEKEARATRRDAEKAAAAVEQRWMAGNEELKKRFEAYVSHFDGAINSVQAAVLRPALRDPKALGFLSAQAEATVSPRAVSEAPEALTQPIPAQARVRSPAQAVSEASVAKVSPRQLHERVQLPVEAMQEKPSSSPRDPLVVQELRETKDEIQEEMADEVVAKLWGQNSEASSLDSARTLAPFGGSEFGS